VQRRKPHDEKQVEAANGEATGSAGKDVVEDDRPRTFLEAIEAAVTRT
jgi:hypothetical protein